MLTNFIKNFREFKLTEDLLEPSFILRTVIPLFDYKEVDEGYDFPNLKPDKFESADQDAVYDDLCKLFWKMNLKNKFSFMLTDEDVEFVKQFHPAVVAIMARAFWNSKLADHVINQDCHLFYKMYVLYLRDFDEKWNPLLDQFKEAEKSDPFIRYWYSKLLYRGEHYNLSNLI